LLARLERALVHGTGLHQAERQGDHGRRGDKDAQTSWRKSSESKTPRSL
jgi:hypothetical protein